MSVTAVAVSASLILAGCAAEGMQTVDESEPAASSPTTEALAGAEEPAAEAPAVSSGPQVVFPSGDTSAMPQCAIGTWILEGTEILQAQFGTVEPGATADGHQLFAFDGTSMVTQNHYSYEMPLAQLTMKYQADWDAQTSGTWAEDSGYWVADTSNVTSATGEASDNTSTYPVNQILASTNGVAVSSCDATTMTVTGWFLANATLRRLG